MTPPSVREGWSRGWPVGGRQGGEQQLWQPPYEVHGRLAGSDFLDAVGDQTESREIADAVVNRYLTLG